MLCRKQLIYNLPTLKKSDLYGFGDDVKIGKCKELRSDCESSLRSLEKIRPSCLLSCLLSPIKDASFEGMKHLKIITFRQSSDAEPLLRKDSEDSWKKSVYLPFRIRLWKNPNAACFSHCPPVKWLIRRGTAVWDGTPGCVPIREGSAMQLSVLCNCLIWSKSAWKQPGKALT